MSSPNLTRKQRREQARQERLEREAAARARQQRQRRMWQIGGALVLVAAIAIAAVAIATSSGSKSAASSSGGAGATAGLQTGPPPWPPEYAHLRERLQALGLPGQSDQIYHVHAMLRVYVNGGQVEVPANLGIDPNGQFLAPLHTHDTTGVVHMEASQPYPFTLGQFFTIWGVKFTTAQLGGYVAGGGNVVATYVNGKYVANGPGYLMKPHDAIVVAYGKPGSFPTSYTPNFAAGL